MSNDPTPTNNIRSKAHSFWTNGQALEAGKLIFECLPVGTRPQWAARVLRLVVDQTGIEHQAVENAIYIANTPSDWCKARDVFSALRKATLELEQIMAYNPQQTLSLSLLLLAELVAKVTYNSTCPSDEFDDDSGWWIAPCLKDILDLVNDEKFSVAAWSMFSLLELDTPAKARMVP